MPESNCCQEDGYACGPFMDQEREIKRLRFPFRNAVGNDWDYLERMLINACRNQQDQQTRFWIEVVKEAREAFTNEQKSDATK
jgi:hypothetical protein